MKVQGPEEHSGTFRSLQWPRMVGKWPTTEMWLEKQADEAWAGL